MFVFRNLICVSDAVTVEMNVQIIYIIKSGMCHTLEACIGESRDRLQSMKSISINLGPNKGNTPAEIDKSLTHDP